MSEEQKIENANLVEITTDDLKPELWVRLLEEMIEGGITFGTKYPLSYLEHKLATKRDEEPLKFGIAISNINDKLLQHGYYLSAREQHDEGYIVLMEDGAEDVARAKVRRSFREMNRAREMFGGIARNPTASITDETRKRLLALEEKAANRLMLMSQPVSIVRDLMEKITRKQLKNGNSAEQKNKQ